MSVWAIGPSIRPNGGTLTQWKAQGYKIGVLRQGESLAYADLEIPTDRYLGWARSINIVAKRILEIDSDVQWMANGNDDTFPDPNYSPEEIATQCTEHFGGTFGVMQPIGDLALWPASRIDTFAGSPWMGRNYCERMYGGNGPMCDEYTHMYGDQECQEVAIKLGVFWQRADLIHQHNHCQRGNPHGAIGGDTVNLPGFLKDIYGPQHWKESTALFNSRRMAGFPGHEPSPSLSLVAA